MTEPTTPPAVELLEPQCETCRFWDHRQAQWAEGLCRRYPLVFEATTWPGTQPDDWCGEYREKV